MISRKSTINIIQEIHDIQEMHDILEIHEIQEIHDMRGSLKKRFYEIIRKQSYRTESILVAIDRGDRQPSIGARMVSVR